MAVVSYYHQRFARLRQRHVNTDTEKWHWRALACICGHPTVSVRSDCPACLTEWVIVSTMDSGHLEVGYGGEEGSEEAELV